MEETFDARSLVSQYAAENPKACCKIGGNPEANQKLEEIFEALEEEGVAKPACEILAKWIGTPDWSVSRVTMERHVRNHRG